MKKIILAFLVVMLAAGAAYALDYEVSGSYYVRGHHNDNLGLATANAAAYQHFDHEFDLRVNFVVSETTKLITRWEILDEEPWDGDKSSSAISYSDSTSAGVAGTVDSSDSWSQSSYGDNIEAEYVYLEHKFATGTILSAGQMPGGTWGTGFQDNGGSAKRIKVVQLFPWGLIVGLVQKIEEQGQAQAVQDGEKDDADAYAIGAVFNVGPVSIMPLWEPIIIGHTVIDQKDDDCEINYYTLDVTGNFGMVGFEATYGIWDEDYRAGVGTDTELSAFYANVWANFEAFKVGGLYYWLEWDDNAGVGAAAGTDWAPTLIMSEEIEAGPGSATYMGAFIAGETAWSTYQVYADFAFGKFSFGGSITYMDSTVDTGATVWRDSTAMEYNVKAKYKITDNLAYDLGLGVASIDYDANYGGDDPEDVTYFFHRLKVSF